MTLAGTLVLSAVFLGACDADEQGRVLNYKKGEYLGPRGAPLDEETLRALRNRAALQGGTTIASGGGGGGEETQRSSDVRPPASGADLRQRGALQRSP